MKQSDLGSMSSDELWMLHEELASTLVARIAAKREVLEGHLRRLGRSSVEQAVRTADRRPYPTVPPKFRNPEVPTETWAGRGKQPRWLTAQLRSGKQIDDFRIESAEGQISRIAAGIQQSSREIAGSGDP
jgi:DNA-binding protein H-NS